MPIATSDDGEGAAKAANMVDGIPISSSPRNPTLRKNLSVGRTPLLKPEFHVNSVMDWRRFYKKNPHLIGQYDFMAKDLPDPKMWEGNLTWFPHFPEWIPLRKANLERMALKPPFQPEGPVRHRDPEEEKAWLKLKNVGPDWVPPHEAESPPSSPRKAKNKTPRERGEEILDKFKYELPGKGVIDKLTALAKYIPY